jgi:hypothetical protein
MLNFVCSEHKKRLYKRQFTPESDQLPLPSLVVFSLFMGELGYEYVELTLESMRLNPNVDFVVVNIVSEDKDSSSGVNVLQMVSKRLHIPNLKVLQPTLVEFRALVKRKLGIDVPLTHDWAWAEKMRDYKPTLGLLFEDHAPEHKYAYWGYSDMDLIWGNITRFSHLFYAPSEEQQANKPRGAELFVNTDWWATNGMASFFLNRPMTRSLFSTDPLFVQLLLNQTYHNLDEEGLNTLPHAVVGHGEHSISELQVRAAAARGISISRGRFQHDRPYVDARDTSTWAGPVLWHAGSLQITQASPEFPSGRELMYFHRPREVLGLPLRLHTRVIREMLQFGYLLPDFVPLLSPSLMCRNTLKSQQEVDDRSASAFSQIRAHHPYARLDADGNCVTRRDGGKYFLRGPQQADAGVTGMDESGGSGPERHGNTSGSSHPYGLKRRFSRSGHKARGSGRAVHRKPRSKLGKLRQHRQRHDVLASG